MYKKKGGGEKDIWTKRNVALDRIMVKESLSKMIILKQRSGWKYKVNYSNTARDKIYR